MSFFHYKVKIQESFKDGNVMGGKLLKANEIHVLSEQDYQKVVQSGGVLDVIEKVIPNPLKKHVVEVVKDKEEGHNTELPEPKEEQKRGAEPTVMPEAKRKAGRPRKIV